jgi:3-deoxy-D-manno-octulosonic-acid transferase
MPFLYDALLTFALLLASPYLLPRILLGRHGLAERLGFRPGGMSRRPPQGRPSIWIHAASVGEVNGLAAFLPDLKKLLPQHAFFLSVTTRAGKERAAELGQWLEGVFYLPVDLSWAVVRVFKRLRPQVLVLTETELWPNLILRARQMGVRVALVNGRLSSRSLKRYRAFRKTLRRIMQAIDPICVQTEHDRSRFLSLGAPPERLRVTGNFKGDLLMISGLRGRRGPVRERLGIGPQDPVLVAGSTRPGEEEILLGALQSLQQKDHSIRTILAPRHIHRAAKVTRLLQAGGLSVERLSRLEDSSERAWEVLVVDNLGQLLRLYAAADVAFVGGSLLPFGGHNPLEPASYGLPVLFGPHMEHCRESARMLLDSSGALQVADVQELQDHVGRLLKNSEERRQRGAGALQAVQKSLGASRRTAEAVKEALI